MKNLAMNLFADDCGAVITAELVLVLTISVLALLVGLTEVSVALNTELNDISNAFGALVQQYSFTGFQGEDSKSAGKLKSIFYGSRWDDAPDDCDANTSCDIVCGVPAGPTTG